MKISEELEKEKAGPKSGKIPVRQDSVKLRKKILEFIATSLTKVTPTDLEKTLAQHCDISRKNIRTIISELVSEGEISYSYHYGRTFIEKSYNRPVRVSDAVILKPPGITWVSKPGDVVIELLHGESFGTGSHPTTRLSIMGIEHVVQRISFFEAQEKASALDIGTGTGVLAIIAVKFGFRHAVGTDIDACARNEARKNIQINGLEDSIEICEAGGEPSDKTFSLIMANLRCPTIKQLCPTISHISAPKSAVVISGIKTDEVDDVLDSYTRKDFSCVWNSSEKGWAGLVLVRRKPV